VRSEAAREAPQAAAPSSAGAGDAPAPQGMEVRARAQFRGGPDLPRGAGAPRIHPRLTAARRPPRQVSVGAGVGWADVGGAAAVVAGAADGARGAAARRSEAEGAAAPGARPKTAAAGEPIAGPPGPPQDFPKLRPKQLAAFNAWARTGWKMPDRANEDALHRDIRLGLMRAGRELEYLRAQLAEQRAAAARHQVLPCWPAS
jgi:hypothetical protein